MRCRHDGRVTGTLYIYIDLVARPWLFSRLFSFCRIPAVWRESKGRTTHGGRPGSASSTWRTTRETSSSRSSLSAPACARPTSLPPFFPHRTRMHCRESTGKFQRICATLGNAFGKFPIPFPLLRKHLRTSDNMASTFGTPMAACTQQIDPVNSPFCLS